jgi:hypothetical protein
MELDGCGAALIWKFRSTDRRPPTALQLYFACRVTTLAAAVTQMTGFNFTSEISCKTWLILTRIFTNTSTTLAMALYALRSIAVWKRNDWLILFVVGCLITNVILWMRLTVKPSAYWNEETHTCIITNTYRGLPNNASMLATDVIFFVVILSGVYQRNSGKHIVITMYNEGLFWLAIATLIQLLPVIFISLDLNGGLTLPVFLLRRSDLYATATILYCRCHESYVPNTCHHLRRNRCNADVPQNLRPAFRGLARISRKLAQ